MRIYGGEKDLRSNDPFLGPILPTLEGYKVKLRVSPGLGLRFRP